MLATPLSLQIAGENADAAAFMEHFVSKTYIVSCRERD